MREHGDPEPIQPFVEGEITPFDQAIGVEDHGGSGLDGCLDRTGRSRPGDAERRIGRQLDVASVIACEHDGRWVSRRHGAHRAEVRVDLDIQHRCQFVRSGCPEERVRTDDDLLRGMTFERVGPYRHAQLAHDARGFQTVPRNVADHERDTAVQERDNVVPVTARLEACLRGHVTRARAPPRRRSEVREATALVAGSLRCDVAGRTRGAL